MTIFEMLEKLETEVVSLRARYQDLANSLEHSRSNGSSRPAPSRRRDGPARKKNKPESRAKGAAVSKRKADTPARTAAAPEQLELTEPVGTQPDEQQGKPLGKRQALGKSLIQLRKMSAWRTGRATPEE